MALENEQAIIRACQEGDKGAFEQLYRCYERPSLALAMRMLGERDEAQDALQDAFLKVYRRIGQFRLASAFSSWLYRIVVNTCYDRLRKRSRAKQVALEDVAEIAVKDRTNTRLLIQRGIETLPPRMKTCFVLFVQEGFKHREIAEMLDVNEGTVRAQVFKAKAQLREALAPRLRGWETDEMH